MLGVTKLLDLANAPPNEIREALKATAVDAKVRSRLMRAIEEIDISIRISQSSGRYSQ